MTFSTSLVAVWYSSDSCRSAGAGLQRAIRLGAADGDHRLLGEGFQQFDLAVGEAARLATADAIAPIARAGAQQWDRHVERTKSRGDRLRPYSGSSMMSTIVGGARVENGPAHTMSVSAARETSP